MFDRLLAALCRGWRAACALFATPPAAGTDAPATIRIPTDRPSGEIAMNAENTAQTESTANSAKRPVLKGLSEIFTYFRTNDVPIWFVSPTPYNVLGLDRWVRRFEYVCYFDSFDGWHPKIRIPRETGPREFRSIEDVNNYLLSHKEIADRMRAAGGGKLVLVMFDEETEALAKELGVEIALPPAELRKRLDSKIETTRIGNEAGVFSVPNVLGRADDYDALLALAATVGLGSDLVVQTPYGDSGRTTFFIASRADWDEFADKIIGEDLKVMKRINHLPGTIEGIATRHGTLVGPLMVDITGFEELTPYKGGWCGNDVAPKVLPEARARVHEMTRRLGDRLYREGYRGTFCMDWLLDTDTGEVWLGELNPRVSGASPMTNLITSTYGGVPMFLFHLLEFMDVDYEIDLEAVQRRWEEFDTWSQLILKHTGDEVEIITQAPTSGIWKMNADGAIHFERRDIDWGGVTGEDEAFYLRVYNAGDYRYHGADMGILVSRGRMQTDDRELFPRAKQWAAGILNQFQCVPLPPAVTVVPPAPETINKMF